MYIYMNENLIKLKYLKYKSKYVNLKELFKGKIKIVTIL